MIPGYPQNVDLPDSVLNIPQLTLNFNLRQEISESFDFGSIVGQIANIMGCTTIGIAGGPEKCAWLTSDVGYDGSIDYKNDRVKDRLREFSRLFKKEFGTKPSHF